MPLAPYALTAAPNSAAALSVQTADCADGKARRDYTDYIAHSGAAQAQGATAFHRLAWLDAVTAATGHQAWLLIARSGNSVCGVLPCHRIASPLFGKALVSTGFAVDGGIIADNQETANALADAFWSLAQSRNCPTAELRGGMLPDNSKWHYKTDSHLGFASALAEDDDAQLKAIPRKQRAEVRKGLKNDLHIRIGAGKQDRDWHYRVYSESVRNLGTPVFPKKLFGQVLESFGDNADILTVLHGDMPVASVLSLYHEKTVMPYWGGGVFAARQLRANDVMYYALMNHARSKGCQTFDFGRSKTDTGAAHFKKNWGFEGQPLAYAMRTADGASPRDINPLSPKYQARIKLWQKLPLPVANIIGPMIARGLG